jgi:MFS family permease
MPVNFVKDIQYYRFCFYGFLKNLRFFEAFLILFFLDKGLTFLEIGILYSIREIVINIIEIPSGIIADSFGRRRTMIFAFVFYIISFIVFYLSGTYFLFVIAMIFYSFGDGMRSGNHKAMVLNYISFKGWKDQKIHYYGHTRSWSQAGSAIAALFGGLIVFITGNYSQIFLFSIIPYLLDLINVFLYPKFLDGNIKKFDFVKMKENFKNVFKELVSSFQKKYILKAIANNAFYSGYYKVIKDYLQVVLQTLALSLPVLLNFNDIGKTSIIIGLAFFIIYFLNSFASKFSGKIADRFKNVYKPLNLSLTIGYFAGLLGGIFFYQNLTFVSVFCYILILIIENIRKPMAVSYISSILDKKIYASTFSINSQIQTLVAAVLAPLLGFFADEFGIGIALIIISLIMILFFPFYFIKAKN